MLSEARMAEEFARKQLEKAPEGSLSIRSRNGKLRYMQRTSKKDPNGKYLGRGSRELVRELEEKAYCLELEKVASEEESGLSRVLETLKKLPDYRTVFLKMPEQKRDLIEPFEVPVKGVGAKKLQNWMKADWDRKYVDPENCYLTQNGEKVRSKSELIIAERLRTEGIPYHYEKPLAIFDRQFGGYYYFHPDFTVLNRRTGQQFYWEHMGKMDDADYCSECLKRLEVYADNGFFQGKNLIVTSESSKHNLNTSYLDKVIKEYLR